MNVKYQVMWIDYRGTHEGPIYESRSEAELRRSYLYWGGFYSWVRELHS